MKSNNKVCLNTIIRWSHIRLSRWLRGMVLSGSAVAVDRASYGDMAYMWNTVVTHSVVRKSCSATPKIVSVYSSNVHQKRDIICGDKWVANRFSVREFSLACGPEWTRQSECNGNDHRTSAKESEWRLACVRHSFGPRWPIILGWMLMINVNHSFRLASVRFTPLAAQSIRSRCATVAMLI